jgi:glycosyltransferase involved in cell wall biosynthesis
MTNDIFKNSSVSIILPVLNSVATIDRCLSSILASDYDFKELIIVDNGSDDGTAEVIKDYAKKDQRIIYCLAPERGRGRARNAGLEIASGDIIAMTDVDCLVPIDWLRCLIAPIQEGSFLAVTGFESDPIGNYWTKMRQEDDWRFSIAQEKDGLINHLDTKNFAILAAVLKESGFDSGMKSCEDWDLFINLKKRGVEIKFLPDLRVAHFHDSSARELFLTQRERGFFAAAIVDKQRCASWAESDFSSSSFLLSLRLRNFFFFPFWALWQFVVYPKAAPYRVIADFAWKIGVISYHLHKHR